jgi:hypothetical protein
MLIVLFLLRRHRADDFEIPLPELETLAIDSKNRLLAISLEAEMMIGLFEQLA